MTTTPTDNDALALIGAAICRRAEREILRADVADTHAMLEESHARECRLEAEIERMRRALIHIAETTSAPLGLRILAADAARPADEDGRRWCGCGDSLEPGEARCWICRSLDDVEE